MTSVIRTDRRTVLSSMLVLGAAGAGYGPAAAQSGAVLGGCGLGFIKHLHAHAIAFVDEGRKTDERLPALPDFEQLRQLAKGPAGMALAHLLRSSPMRS